VISDLLVAHKHHSKKTSNHPKHTHRATTKRKQQKQTSTAKQTHQAKTPTNQHHGSLPPSMSATLLKKTMEGTLKYPAVLQTLIECVLPPEVDSIATSLMYYYQMNGLGYEVLSPVLAHYLSSSGMLRAWFLSGVGGSVRLTGGCCWCGEWSV
jgi:hypothetical protein